MSQRAFSSGCRLPRLLLVGDDADGSAEGGARDDISFSSASLFLFNGREG
ncbi:hypothetical protein IMZ48_28275 [Candidatus Bathyarchaeota archaeon]|nr:hypothetical protein [Candidatus Bathyarchaeota archaeon]